MAGLRNMRTSLKPGGTMTMIVWRGIKDNPWLGLAKQVVLEYLPPPGEKRRPADRDRSPWPTPAW